MAFLRAKCRDVLYSPKLLPFLYFLLVPSFSLDPYHRAGRPFSIGSARASERASDSVNLMFVTQTGLRLVVSPVVNAQRTINVYVQATFLLRSGDYPPPPLFVIK
jgi:hypothetical protein